MNKPKPGEQDRGLRPVHTSLRFADRLPDIVARFDRELRHLYVNHAAEHATGLPAGAFLGKTNRELGMPEELVARWDQALLEVFRSGIPVDLDFLFQGPRGEQHMRTHVAPEHDDNGLVTSVVSVARDVTAEQGVLALLSVDAFAEHYKAIIESSDDAIISKTLDGIVTSWNRGAQAVFGYPEAEMLGRSMRILFPDDRQDEERFILEKLLAGEKVDHFETERIRKDGQRIHVSVSISPIRDRLGRVIGASKIARDITARVHLETAAGRYDAIVESTQDAVIGKSLAGTITSWNAGAQALFGHRAQDMIGRPIHALLPLERMDEEERILEKLRRGEKVEHFETVRVRQDGSRIDVSVTISPIRDPQGRIVGASKIARDITRRKQAESRLRLTASVFTHTSEGIAITDPLGRILEVNDAFTRITGFDRVEVQGRTAAMFASGRQGPEKIDAMRALLQERGDCQSELWSRRKDGRAFAAMVTVSVVRDAAGRVQNYVGLFADVTALRMQQERLEHVAHYDALTDLPNRLLLADRLLQAMAVADRHQQTLAVVYLDLDGFKAINDRHGHAVGDQLLVAVSHRVRDSLREVDTLARIGGDEFVAVLVDVHGPDDCAQLVERILDACAQPVEIGGHVLRISASIGVTLYPSDDSDADQLMRHADRAMYDAKQAGKNRYHLFDAAQDAEFKSRGRQLGEFAGALRSQALVLHYQPKVNLRTREVMGVEALVRWQHPQRGLLPPADFLHLVERHPLGEALCHWVLREAMAQMTAWRLAGLHLPVSVNIGGRQLQPGNFVRRLGEMLAEFPLVRPADLELEILETSALEDIGAVSGVMRECKSLGVGFAVDDFGTGYSSLTYLRQLPAGTLKIDQSFVRGMLVNGEDLAIVRGVVGLATAFGRTVIAEGVESAAHGAQLLEMGCELGQGFGIAFPMTAADLEQWLRSADGPIRA